MRGFLVERAGPFAALFVALIVVNAAATGLVFARGLPFTLGAAGLFLQLPLVLALAGACFVVLTRLKGLPPERVGLRLDRASLAELGAATLAGLGLVAALVLVLSALGGVRLSPASEAPGPVAALVALASFVVNGALQEIGLQGIVLSVGRDGRLSVGAALFANAVFVATHAAETSSALTLTNVGLFGLAATLLAFRRERASFALATGLHGGWNAALAFLGGHAEDAGASGASFVSASPSDVLWSGGRAGLEAGLAYTLLLVGLVAVMLGLRARAASRAS